MANSEGEVLVTPTATHSVNITTTNTASFDLDLYIVVTKRLHIELVLVELGPGFRRIDLEAGVLIVFRHGRCGRRVDL